MKLEPYSWPQKERVDSGAQPAPAAMPPRNLLLFGIWEQLFMSIVLTTTFLLSCRADIFQSACMPPPISTPINPAHFLADLCANVEAKRPVFFLFSTSECSTSLEPPDRGLRYDRAPHYS